MRLNLNPDTCICRSVPKGVKCRTDILSMRTAWDSFHSNVQDQKCFIWSSGCALYTAGWCNERLFILLAKCCLLFLPLKQPREAGKEAARTEQGTPRCSASHPAWAKTTWWARSLYNIQCTWHKSIHTKNEASSSISVRWRDLTCFLAI